MGLQPSLNKHGLANVLPRTSNCPRRTSPRVAPVQSQACSPHELGTAVERTSEVSLLRQGGLRAVTTP
jgi:hypothetical protein